MYRVVFVFWNSLYVQKDSKNNDKIIFECARHERAD